MIAYQKQIIENSICYIAQQFYEKTGSYPYQMIVYKLLALLDFNSVKTKGRPCTGLTYKALPMGPVPDELYNKDESLYTKYETRITFSNGKKYKQYIPKGEADMDYICPSELNFLNSKINLFISRNFSTEDASDYTHENIKAWKKTWDASPCEVINYGLEFDENPYNKDPSKLSMEEEMFITYNDFN